MSRAALALAGAVGVVLTAVPSSPAATHAKPRAAAHAEPLANCASLTGNTLDRRRIAIGQSSATVRLVEQGTRDQRILLCRDTTRGAKLVRLSRLWTDGGTSTEFIADGAITADGGAVLQGQALSDADPPSTFWQAYTPAGKRTGFTRIDLTSAVRQDLHITESGGYVYTDDAGLVHGVDTSGDRVLSTTTATDVATSGDRAYWMEGETEKTVSLTGRATTAS